MYDKVRYNNEYNKQAYDRLNIQVPKGQKAIIEEHWRARGYKSLNAYVNELIRRDMEESIDNSDNSPQAGADAGP